MNDIVMIYAVFVLVVVICVPILIFWRRKP